MAKKKNGWKKDFGDLFAAMDTEIRQGQIRARMNAVKELMAIKDHRIGPVDIPAEALLPENWFEAERVILGTEIFIRDNGVSFTRGPFGCGQKARLTVTWRSKPAPEATALVRTKAEGVLAATIKHGSQEPLTTLTPATKDN